MTSERAADVFAGIVAVVILIVFGRDIIGGAVIALITGLVYAIVFGPIVLAIMAVVKVAEVIEDRIRRWIA